MYSAPYGGPTFNGATPPNPHLQPAPGPNQPQQMMYNPQQFPMGAQGPFPGGPNVMPAAGPAGMMQNTAMPHMAANGQMPYQTPYANSPYGAATPSSNAPQPQLPPNFNMMANSMPGFPMNAAGMPQQQAMMQRMHPGQQNAASMGMSTPQRQFSGPQGGPPTSMPSQQQQQFSTPQNPQGTPQNHTPNSGQPNNPAISTPQTPTFPSGGQGPTVNGTSTASTPLSPGTESKEKEVFSLLLDINQELLCDSIQLQNTQQELKKEQAAGKAEDGSSNEPKKPSEEEKLVQQDYILCMRRLQANLAFLASLADRKGAIPKGPQYLMPPAMNLSIKLRGQTPLPAASDSADGKVDPNADREERDKYLRELYKKLQALYPSVDPRKEPAFPPPGQNAGQGGQQGQNAQKPGGARGSNHGSPAPPGARGTPQMATVSGPPQAQPVTTT